MQTQITLTITHARPIDDLVEKVAARAYTLDGVDNAEASKELMFDPVELAGYGLKIPTPREFADAITKRLNGKWSMEVEKLNERLKNQEFWVADAILEKNAALARLAEIEAQNLLARRIILEHNSAVAATNSKEAV